MQSEQRATLATLVALLLGFGLMQMGNTLQGTLLSVRGQIESFSPAQIGAVGAGLWVGIVIGSLYSGKLILRVGHIRAFLALGAIASTAPLLHLLVLDPIAWMAARALTGFCFAGLFIVVESWLNSAATGETRGQILSVYAMTGLLAGIIGQLLLSATDTTGFKPFCIVAIIIALALVPIALTKAVAPTHEGGGARINLIGLYRQSPFGLVAASLCGVTTSAFFTLGPILAQRRGLDTGGIAVFMASGTLGGFLMAWPLGWLSDRVDRRLVIIGAAITAATTLGVMIALVPDEATRWLLYLCAAIFGGTIIPTYSVVMAHVNDAVGEGEFVAASGGLLIMQGVGAVAGPLIAGFAMSASELGFAYTVIATQLLMAAFGLYRLRCRAAPPELHKGNFVIEPSVPVGTALSSAHSQRIDPGA
ncbi:MAG: MFS transporter [Verrucomicrobia bacterium]|nr:MFS transporter [Verrucomicrobiota bacterium]